jgi:hypothetical protein
MQPPNWDDPIGSACREAEPAILRGLSVRPTLHGFVADQPVVRVQAGAVAFRGDGEVAFQHLAVVPVVLGLDQVLVFSRARTTDHRIEDEDLRAAVATYGIAVEVAQRRGDVVTTEACLVEREVVDDAVRWSDPQRLTEGFWTGLLRAALAGPPAGAGDGLSPADLAYGLSRAGTVVEVAPGWRERFGTDRVDARRVRSGDRRRARDHARPASGPRPQAGSREVRA